ncbi:MAG: GNAT family N-acetyltransferase [Chloroflexi bacterium]|nr:GNAT family N-acetyltransferase [Chloroflexota bacterium]
MPFEVDIAQELIDCYLEQGDASGYHVRVSEADGAVVGYVCYGWTPLTQGTWDIYWIAVAPSEKGRGIGKALMAHAEAEIGKARGRLILVETSSKPSYERTRNFYNSQGYQLITSIPDFYCPGDDKLTLQKRLR